MIDFGDKMKLARDEAEREVLEAAVKKAPKLRNGQPNLTSAAESLNWSRATLYEKLKQHGLWPWKPKKA